jgi:hypothetical protein
MSLEIIPERPDLLSVIKTPKDTIIFVDTKQYKESSNFKLLLMYEPEAIIQIEEYVLANYPKYDLILTYNDAILRNCKNARLFTTCAYNWIPKEEYEIINMSDKEFKISSLTGFKRMTSGHDFRQMIYFNQEGLIDSGIPIVFYRSSAGPPLPTIRNNPFIYTSKSPLFSFFQFSIIVENSRQLHYFTEKLIDCIIMKTIPIYYGCPNIDQYFNTKGWIILDSESMVDLYTKLSSLNDTWYSTHKDVVMENYEKALMYAKGNCYYDKLNTILGSI